MSQPLTQTSTVASPDAAATDTLHKNSTDHGHFNPELSTTSRGRSSSDCAAIISQTQLRHSNLRASSGMDYSSHARKS